jgi:AraC-like DNA-binding protein
MTLTDLISSINHALPQLVASPHCWFDREICGATYRYGRLRTVDSAMSEEADACQAGVGSYLQSLGILGFGPLARSVAGPLRLRFQSDVVCHEWGTPVQPGFDGSGVSDSLRSALGASTICVVLPWPEELAVQPHPIGLMPVNAQTVIVAWRRCPAIERALVYLGQHCLEPVNLGDLAHVACISKFHLVRKFTAMLGVTPHRYQLMLRLSHAKAMLRAGVCITKIAHGVGFADHSHLNRSFRVLLGMTPSQYQRSFDRLTEAISF